MPLRGRCSVTPTLCACDCGDRRASPAGKLTDPLAPAEILLALESVEQTFTGSEGAT
jgi:hypothetical protein